MKLLNNHTFNIFFSLFVAIGQCACQEIKNEPSVSSTNRVFDKKPKLDTLLNEFLIPLGYTNDYGGLFTKDEIFHLDSLLYEFEKKTSLQIVVVSFDSILAKPNEIVTITRAIGNRWKVGGDSSFGVVVAISKPFRQMRIENGYQARRYISDSETQTLIDSFFIPEFKNNEYYKGTLSGIEKLIEQLDKSLIEKPKVRF